MSERFNLLIQSLEVVILLIVIWNSIHLSLIVLSLYQILIGWFKQSQNFSLSILISRRGNFISDHCIGEVNLASIISGQMFNAKKV